METIEEQYKKAYDQILQRIDDNMRPKQRKGLLIILTLIQNISYKKYKNRIIKKLNRQYLRAIK